MPNIAKVLASVAVVLFVTILGFVIYFLYKGQDPVPATDTVGKHIDNLTERVAEKLEKKLDKALNK